MNPLSPLYFIKENKSRCILLMFMIFLSFGAYLGGIYIHTPQENWDYPCELNEKMVCLHAQNNDKNYENYYNLIEEINKLDNIHVIERGWYNEIERKTVMGFTDGSFCITFRTVDDFRYFCEYNDIDCDFTNIKPKTMVMNKRMAALNGYEIGDVISPDNTNTLSYDFTIAALTDEPGYTQYFIGEETEINCNAMLFGEGISAQEVRKQAEALAKKYPVNFSKSLREETEEVYNIFNTIFMLVIVFLALILSVTVNAAFVGMYQRREFEFAVYRAIGIPKSKLKRKIAGEIITMDLIVLIVGGIIFFLGLYLFNELVLKPNGLYLVYYAPLAIIALILCNIMTVIPLIITRSRVLLKANVCDY